MTARELAERFDISIEAAQIRLEEVARIKRRASGIRRPLPASVVQYLDDAEKKGFRTTTR